MVSNKTVWILIVLSLLLLGASFAISTLNTDSGKLNTNAGGGNQQGSVSLVINPPAQPVNDSGTG